MDAQDAQDKTIWFPSCSSCPSMLELLAFSGGERSLFLLRVVCLAAIRSAHLSRRRKVCTFRAPRAYPC